MFDGLRRSGIIRGSEKLKFLIFITLSFASKVLKGCPVLEDVYILLVRE